MPRSSLAGTGFHRIWAGESISLVGAQVTYFAMPLVAVLSLHANAFDMGLLNAAGSLAVLLLGPSIGVWADRREQRGAMIGANLARCLLLAAVPVAWYLGALNLPLLLVVAFGVGALSLLFDSAMASYVPALVGKDRLLPANSWMQSSVSVADTAGPGLAGVLVQVLGAPLAVAVDALSYLASTVALVGSPRSRGKAAPDEHDDETHWQAVRHGLRMVLRDGVQRPLVLAAAHFNFFTAMFFALYILYLVRSLHFSPLLIGLLNVAGGVAGLAGAAISNRLTARYGYGPVLALAYALPGGAAILVPLAGRVDLVPGAVLVALSSAVWSGSVVVNLILSESVKQTVVPHAYLGRATSVIRFVSFGVEPIGALLASGLVALGLGLGGTMLLASVGVGTSSLWLVVTGVHRLRHVAPPEETDQVNLLQTGIVSEEH
ncbi:MFS transporter [Streptomyces sp. 8L]|uniref:MFS transporter n=1 Tax=Streptomyces sp. 8L TaxID=2877242 RepID=UPI001CD682D9|nr:MFS transporter [Streptomyces sp. 8L]MCA1217118.1 MFS transporter [Streptomyces sp. 8L]